MAKKLGRIIIFMVLMLIAVSMLYPLFYMGINTFKKSFDYMKDSLGLPSTLYLDNYVSLFRAYKIYVYFFNSLITSSCALVITLGIGIVSSYAFAKVNFKWKKQIYLAVLSLMMIPGMVMLIPLYVFYTRIGLIDNRLSLIIQFSVGSLPYAVFLLTSNFRGIPNEMIEAVKIDGGNYFTTIRAVIIPMGKAAIIAMGIFLFIGNWNELLFSMLFINTQSKMNMTAIIANFSNVHISNEPMILTGLTFTAIPMIIIYLVLQRYIIKGITVGSFK